MATAGAASSSTSASPRSQSTAGGSGMAEQRRVGEAPTETRGWSWAGQLRRRAVRERLGEVLRQDVGSPRERRPCGRRGPRARARDRRAAAARQRGRAAPKPPPCGAASSREPPRSGDTRSRTGADGSDGGAASSSARGRGIATTRSKRSSSARDTLSRYAAIRAGGHAHSRRGSPRPPHGHRFIVATSRKRAGKSARPPTRATETTPSSSGCRRASSTGRGNSGSSSRRSTPRCARLTSPGRGTYPPPTTAAADAPW